ncbi:MAG: glycosyltransferase family 9 protein [Candidatus Omnitrophota bacterium]
MLKNINYQNILIFGHSNIGDVCYDLGIISVLKNNFPQSRISFISSPKSQEVASLVQEIDEVIVFDKYNKNKGILGHLKFVNLINKKKFDLAIILRGQMHYFFNIPKIIQLTRNKKNNLNRPALEQYIDLLKQIGIKDANIKFNFNFSQKDIDFVKKEVLINQDRREKIKIGIMPFAAWKLKCWPVEKWNELVKQLQEKYKAEVFVFGKTRENDQWEDDFNKNLSKNIISFVNKCTLRKTLAIISQLDLFIGCDTSLLHFASCLRVNTIGLFGPTNSKKYYPFFHKDLVVISKSKLNCMPCFQKKEVGPCGVKGKPAACMQEITVKEVMDRVIQVRANKVKGRL